MTYTMEKMWGLANLPDVLPTETGKALAECLNRIEKAMDKCTETYGQQKYFGTEVWGVAEDVMFILDGEPDGADD